MLSATSRFCDSPAPGSSFFFLCALHSFSMPSSCTCQSCHPARDYAGTPFAKKQSDGDCAPITTGSTSSCSSNGYDNHYPLCYCVPPTSSPSLPMYDVDTSSPGIICNHSSEPRLGIKKYFPPKRFNRDLNRNRESWPGLKKDFLCGTAHRDSLMVFRDTDPIEI